MYVDISVYLYIDIDRELYFYPYQNLEVSYNPVQREIFPLGSCSNQEIYGSPLPPWKLGALVSVQTATSTHVRQ